MAVDRKEFTEQVEPCIKANKKFTRFYLSFKFNNKAKQKVIDYSKKDWDKRTRVTNAKTQLTLEKTKAENSSVNFTENSTLNNIAKLYFSLACDNTKWAKERQEIYNLYCGKGIGRKKIRLIRQVDIDALRKSMEKKGFSKQTEDGCSPGTIKKVLIQVLKPVMVYALANKVLTDIPTIKAPKQSRNKKIVDNAGQKFKSLFEVIFSLYNEDCFYRSLFLFALNGRRWNEIRTLTWEVIDFEKSTYTILAKHNKSKRDQTYEIPFPIIESLTELKEDNAKGLVFKSPKTNRELHPPKRQLEKLKENADIPNLTMHYFRHIYVSAMGEVGTAGTVLSAALGHTNLDTVNNFYLSANHKKASIEANKTIALITGSR